MKPRRSEHQPPRDKLGVWVFGARGGLATTMVVGARAIGKGMVGTQGLLTETPGLDRMGLQGIKGLVFGGHEVRQGTSRAAAEEIYENTGTISYPMIQRLRGDLNRFDLNIRRGCLINAGKTIVKLATGPRPKAATLSQEVARLQKDIRDFMTRNKLRRCVCVNLTSTEPKLRLTRQHDSIGGFEQIIRANKRSLVRPSAIYGYVAASLGLPFIHFTPLERRSGRRHPRAVRAERRSVHGFGRQDRRDPREVESGADVQVPQSAGVDLAGLQHPR